MSEAAAAAPPPLVCLDLVLHPDDAAAFWRSPALADLRRGARIRSTPLEITWHDGGDRALDAAGLALAQTRLGRREVWRLERRRPAAHAPPWPPAASPPVLGEAGAAAALSMPLPEPLVPLAAFSGTCRSVRLGPEAPVSVLHLQAGTLHANGAAPLPACRIALSGPGPDAFSLARALAQGLRLTVPRAALADEAAHSQALPARHLGAPVLPDGATVSEALAVAIGQLADALLYWAPLVDPAGGPEPVHQMRVALRRLRSALKVFGKAAAGPALDEAAAGLRDLARLLGHARDWDVFLRGIGQDVAAAFEGERAAARLLAAAERARLARYVALRSALDGPPFRTLSLFLAELATCRPWSAAAQDSFSPDSALPPFARAMLDRRMHKVLHHGRGFGRLPPQALHALRLQCKRLRYAAEMFAPLFPGHGARRFLRRLVEVQDQLGALNDGAVAAGLLDELGRFRGRPLASGLVRGFVTGRSAAGREAARQGWRRLRACTPFWE